MRRAALLAVVWLLVAVAGPAAAAPPRTTSLWYRVTVFGWYQETQDGASPSGTIRDDEYASWIMRSNVATTVTRVRGVGIRTSVNLRGTIKQYDHTSSTDFPNSSDQRCSQQGRFAYSEPSAGATSPQLSGAVHGFITRPTIVVAGGGTIDVDGVVTFTCPGGSSRTPRTEALNLDGLDTVLLPPRALLEQHGLSPEGPIRFGRFFSLVGSYTISRPLSTLIVGAEGTWVRRWGIDVWFDPCPNLRC